MTKTSAGNFFEDFRLGQTIRHATPRTMSMGDVALYTGLFGPRFAVQSSDDFAKAIGLTLDGSKFGMGTRSQRYTMLVHDGVVEQLFVEAPGEFKVSSAEHLLSQI